MAAVDLVITVGKYKKAADTIDPARQKLNKVERRFIGPMYILKYDQHGFYLQLQFVKHGHEQGSAIVVMFLVSP